MTSFVRRRVPAIRSLPAPPAAAERLLDALTHPFTRVLRQFSSAAAAASTKSSTHPHYYAADPAPEPLSALADAELVTSQVNASGLHAPVLDIDFPVRVADSATPGHSHLYLNVLLTWRQYKCLLRALADAGIVEEGYARASINRGYSAVRVPWRPKPLKGPPAP